MDTFDLLLEFDDQSPAFALGFEAGRIWEILKQDWRLLDQHPIHAKNSEIVMRMLEKLELTGIVRTQFSENEKWMVLVDATKRSS
jgi:hypothetical protein